MTSSQRMTSCSELAPCLPVPVILGRTTYPRLRFTQPVRWYPRDREYKIPVHPCGRRSIGSTARPRGERSATAHDVMLRARSLSPGTANIRAPDLPLPELHAVRPPLSSRTKL